MNDRPLGSPERLDGAFDQVLARLGEHLDGHVVGNPLLFDQAADEIEVRLRGGGESDFDLFEAEAHQELEEAQLTLGAHGLDQGLVTVAQIDAAPDGGLGEHPVGPGAVGQLGNGGGMVAAGIEGHD